MMLTGRVSTANGEFHFLTRGQKEDPLVLCLHGFPDHPHSFEPLMNLLADRGYRVVAPWMRGYGPSVSEGPYHADQLGSDAIELVKALSPNAPAAIIGHDWGAVATYSALVQEPTVFSCAITMAVPHPSAFLKNSLSFPAQFFRSWYMFFFQLRTIADRVVERGDFAFIDYLWETWSPGYRLPRPQMKVLKECLRAAYPAPLDYYRAIFWPPKEAWLRIKEGAVLNQQIQVPLLHLHGATDGCISAEIANGQEKFFAGPFDTRIIAGAGHFMQLEAPHEVGELSLQWLRRFFQNSESKKSA